MAGFTKQGPERLAVRDGRFKYIVVNAPAVLPMLDPVPEEQLYDLLDDPGEQREASADHPKVVKSIGGVLVRWSRRLERARQPARPKAMDPAHLERLKALGYVK